VGYAQTVDPALEKARQARDAARISGDEQTWGRYTTDDFMIMNGSGQQTKSERMAAIKGNKSGTAPSPKSSDLRLRVYGDTVIRTARQDPPTGAVMLTEVWVKQSGTWKVAHVQFTPVQKP
jgi:hypothetical protein